MVNILSLDGGGTWALLQVRALGALYPGKRGHEILSYYDYAFANSGGSIVLGGLLLNLLPTEIEQQFTDAKQRSSMYQPSSSLGAAFLRLFKGGAKYSTLAKQKALDAVFGDLPLASLPHPDGRLTKIVIVAFDYVRSRAFFFRSAESPRFPTVRGMTLASAIHASSTAPVLYFDRPAEFMVDVVYPGVTSIPINMQLWDGGVTGLNNPIAAAIGEAISASVPAREIAALSIGTGSVIKSNNWDHQGGDPDQLALPRESPGPVADIEKLASSILDDPPDFASFLAHTMTGGIAPAGAETITNGRVVRMNPLVLGDFDKRLWKRPLWNEPPLPGGGPDLFGRLQNMGMDATGQQDVVDIGKLGDAWINDLAKNQPIRGNFFQDADMGYHAEIGHLTFSEAWKAARALKLVP